ncbi:MAG TPA: zinc-dependent alcohol dehydrogenase family protein [Steroidobacteraceae bacterium]|jgi:alcohol dehydrogenase|nr:zinc-dependent alcohol dehydrogenase family protein [Steroidobacteraceae bacterium]
MKTLGAILREPGKPRPYSVSRPLELTELELDPPGSREVLVQLRAAGICHSDLSVVDGSRPRPTPMVLGHEAAGIVIQAGKDVTGLEIGDHVVAVFVPACRQCADCSSGRPALCEAGNRANGEGTLLSGLRRLHGRTQAIHHHCGISGFAQFAVMAQSSLVRVDKSLPLDIAALFGCAVLTGVGAVMNSARVASGQHVAVIGLGGVGMAAVLGARAAGAASITAIDTLPHKLEQAARLGATATFTADAPDLVALVREATRGGVDAAFDMSGSVRALEMAWQLTRRGGRTVSCGLPDPGRRLSLSPAQLVAEERILQGSYLGGGDPAVDIPRYVDWYRQGRLPVAELISARLPLERINEGMDALATGSALRQIIVFP